MNKKLEKIKLERKKLLQMVSNNIKENGTNVSENIEELSNVLKVDEESTKKYEAIIKAKKIIAELTLEIANCKNPEEIAKVRNRINYYINKIKKELVKRNISETEMTKYCNSVSVLRDNIAKYVRCLKRENNLVEIDKMQQNMNNLTIDDKTKLKKLLKNEVAFNHRNMASKKENIEVKIESDEKIVVPALKEEIINIALEPLIFVKEEKEKIEPLYIDTKEKVEEPDELCMGFEEKEEEKTEACLHMDINNTDASSNVLLTSMSEYDVLKAKTDKYSICYNIIDVYKYKNSFTKNLASFVKNLPKYSLNKKRIKAMEKDYSAYSYYHGRDLKAYMEYTRKRNSILYGLKNILNRSYLNSEESKCLNNHEKCVDWIMNYCNTQIIDQYSLVKTA